MSFSWHHCQSDLSAGFTTEDQFLPFSIGIMHALCWHRIPPMVVKGESEMLPSMPFLHTVIVNEIRAIIDRLRRLDTLCTPGRLILLVGCQLTRLGVLSISMKGLSFFSERIIA